jgi:hypothetical protein
MSAKCRGFQLSQQTWQNKRVAFRSSNHVPANNILTVHLAELPNPTYTMGSAKKHWKNIDEAASWVKTSFQQLVAFAHGNTLKPRVNRIQLRTSHASTHQYQINGAMGWVVYLPWRTYRPQRQGIRFPLGVYMYSVTSILLASRPLSLWVFSLYSNTLTLRFPISTKYLRLKYPITHQQNSGQTTCFCHPWLPFKFTRPSRVQVMGFDSPLLHGDSISIHFSFSPYFKATYE